MRSAHWAQEIGGVGARAIKRLLTPRLVYPQEPAPEDDLTRPAVTPGALRRRSPWALGALPAVAALLLVTLSLAVFSGLALGGRRPQLATKPTMTPAPVVSGLRAAETAVAAVAVELAFTPVLPSYLPAGAQLREGPVVALGGTKAANALTLNWVFAAASGLQQITLRETNAGQGFVGCQSATPTASGGGWVRWGLPTTPTWNPLTCQGRAAWPAVGQIRATLNIALTVAPGSRGADLAVEALRITSLSMDMPYLDQLNFLRAFGANTQPGGAQYLHYTATAIAAGQQWQISGETNAPYTQTLTQRRERITITESSGASVTDVVNGAQAIRLNNASATYLSSAYPTQTPTTTGQDAEPAASVTYLFDHIATLLAYGEVWALPTKVRLNNRQVYQLVMVDTPAPTTVYVDVQTYVVTRIVMGAGSGPGSARAPTRLITSAACPSTSTTTIGASSTNCQISYSALWITATPDAANDFSLTPPTGYGRALVAHLTQLGSACQTL